MFFECMVFVIKPAMGGGPPSNLRDFPASWALRQRAPPLTLMGAALFEGVTGRLLTAGWGCAHGG